MRRVLFPFSILAVCVAYCQFFPLVTRADDSLKETNSTSDIFLFPYNSCILTIVEEELLPDLGAKCRIENAFVAKLRIIRVLRGNFVEGETVTVSVPENDADYLRNGRPSKELVGRKCLLAFNASARQNEQFLTVSNLYCPLRGQQITDAVVKKLQQDIDKAPCQYRTCLAVTILNTSQKSLGDKHKKELPTVLVVTARVDDILLDARSGIGLTSTNDDRLPKWKMEPSESFKVGELIKFNLGSSSPENIFPTRPKSDWLGSKCIWSFNSRKGILAGNERLYFLDDVSAPFPNQVYTLKNVEDLRAKLSVKSVQFRELGVKVQRYVNDCCSLERLRDFCQPENRCSGVFRSFPLTENNRVLYGKFFPSDTGVNAEFANATWFADIVNGVPRAYEILIDRGGPERWLFHSPISLRPCIDDEFVRERLFQTLRYSILNYMARHCDDGLAAGLENIQLIPPGVVTRDSEQRISAFRCCLTNGQTLQADIDRDQKICSVLISGKPSEIVKEALKTTVENWDWCWRQREGGAANGK